MARTTKVRPPLRGNKRGSSSTQRMLDELAASDRTIPMPRTAPVKPLEAKTPNQGRYMKAIATQQVTFGVGCAGTGKTYIAGAMAAMALEDGTVDQIIITRPAVEAGEKLGFLPGEKEDKYEPYIAAFMGVLNERLGKGKVEYLMKSGKIIGAPLAYMRGHTFKNAFVIMDEAQNATPVQMKLFLTRIGEDSIVVVNGDTDQVDIVGPSGLTDAIKKVAFIPSVSVVQFGLDDGVRSGICSEIVRAYAQPLN